MFGDSVQSSPVNTLGHKSGGSLSSLYQARKANDSATVEQIKQQFQRQIEQMKQASQRHESVASRQVGAAGQIAPPPQFRPSVDQNNFSQQPPVSAAVTRSLVTTAPAPDASLPTRVSVEPAQTERHNNIERGKSFLEARSAVQKQIEKMFVDSQEKKDEFPKSSPGIKHASHGVSHVTPEEEDTYNPPPPVHFGVDKALKSLSSSPGSSVSKTSVSEKKNPPSLSSSSPSSKILSFNTSNLTLVNNNSNNNNISLGNIDIGRKRDVSKNSLDRSKRASMHEDLIVKSAGLREKRVKDEVNLNRRISIHQDKFDPSSRPPPSLPLPSPPSLPPSSSRSTTIITSEAEYEPISVPPSEASTAPSSRVSKTGRGSRNGSNRPVKHRIEYLGAVPLSNKATNLQALQGPMKELYFKNKALKSLGHSNLPGTLEIMETGMKIQYIRELHKGVQEIFNPFPTIAVWAAVKFVVKKEQDPMSGDIGHKFAFLPLIADPDDGGKTELFYPLTEDEADLASGPSHPALFAAVMRKAGVAKQLECHGFVCDSPEEAILVAANLYQALLETMKRNKRAGSASQVSFIKIYLFLMMMIEISPTTR